ncbi:MAG TPA: pyridoxal-dependent decarboxylase, partial [Chloroflexota bacterium]
DQETLDPDDLDELRALGHHMLDDMFDRLTHLRERPVWHPVPERARRALQAPVPMEGEPVDAVYAQFVESIAQYSLGNDHPRFWGWVMGNGTPLGMLAEMLAAGMNPNVGGGEHAANYVEAQVIDWCKELLGFPPEASGLLVSGGSMANLLALAVARSRVPFDVRHEGLQAAPRHVTLYGSSEMHSSIQRAVEVLGLGSRNLRVIPVDRDDMINMAALRTMIVQDLEDGFQPLCLIANAGTTNTGAIDPLHEMADLAATYGMWLHVDGAFGALAVLSPELKPLVAGIERADSIAFDLHKWGYQPFEVGCTLVRDAQTHLATFSLTPEYLKHGERGTAGASLWFSDYGVELTRGFRALKVWMAFKVHGVDKLGRLARQNVEQARYLAELVERSPSLELLAPVALNVVCFRYSAPGLDERQTDALNEEVVIRLQEGGIAVPSGTRVRGRYAIRCAITNHRSRWEDFELLVQAVQRIGQELA